MKTPKSVKIFGYAMFALAAMAYNCGANEIAGYAGIAWIICSDFGWKPLYSPRD